MRRFVLTIALAAAFTSPAFAAYAGRPLVEALADLESRGLRLIYSDDVVTPAMMVGKEPVSTNPRGILDELLAQHALEAEPGPRHTLVIVRAKSREHKTASRPQMPVALAEITVTPGRLTLGDDAAGRAVLDRDDLRRLAHIADDVYRAVARLPGTASLDMSARFNLRGGEEDEVLVLVDGAEIYDPFHMKDLLRAFSVIDSEAIGAADVYSGGFPVEFGGRASGVVALTTLHPDETAGELGIGLLQARLLSRGTSGAGRGGWLVSARHGYIREMIELVGSEDELDPRYGDLIGKLEWMIGDASVASVHVLASRDRLRLNEEGRREIDASYEDTYLWGRFRGAPHDRLYIDSVLSAGELQRERSGKFDTPGFQAGELQEERKSRILAWKNDATYQLTPRNLVKFGLTLRDVDASYDFDASARIVRATHDLGAPPREIDRHVELDVDGSEVAAYVADRFLLTDSIVVEAGARIESETHTPDGARVTPRLNLAWSIAPRTHLRAGWGVVDQAQRIDELSVEDGVTEFARARRAEHFAFAVEHRFARGIDAKLDLYDKRLSRLEPRFENLYDRVLLFPELRDDRVKIDLEGGRARGAELLVRAGGSEPLSGWLGYTLARVTDRIGGRDVPRAWDQRHSLTAGIDWRFGSGWSLNLGGTWRTGWPTTPVIARVEEGELVSEPGPLRSARLDSYQRFDLRVARAMGDWRFFFEIFNVLGSENQLRIDHFRFTTASDGSVVAVPVADDALRWVPSLGVTRRW